MNVMFNKLNTVKILSIQLNSIQALSPTPEIVQHLSVTKNFIKTITWIVFYGCCGVV